MMMFAIGVENPLLSGLVLAVGTALALLLGGMRSRWAGVPAARVWLLSALIPLCAAFFAHLAYCLVDVEYTLYSHSVGYLFAFWQPGYMMWGGIAGALLALLLGGGQKRGVLLDAYAPAMALAIAAARIAEGLMGQGYGEYWYDDPIALCRFPYMVYDPYYEAWGWALFVLEALVALVLFVALLRRRNAPTGDGALLLCGLYAAAQIVLESLRRDEFLRWGFVRVEEVLSAVAVLAVLIICCVRAGRGKALQKTLCFALFAAMVVLCLLLEFATEGRIPFLLFLEVEHCYMVMAAACAVIAACVLWMRSLAVNTCVKEPE